MNFRHFEGAAVFGCDGEIPRPSRGNHKWLIISFKGFLIIMKKGEVFYSVRYSQKFRGFLLRRNDGLSVFNFIRLSLQVEGLVGVFKRLWLLLEIPGISPASISPSVERRSEVFIFI